MHILQHGLTGPDPCPYLPGPRATTETLLMTSVAPAELEVLLERGWRRFGPVYFRPVCGACGECISVRVPVATFQPSKNLERVLRRAADVRVKVGKPLVDDERLALYRRWHANREGERGWKPDHVGRDTYEMQFSYPHPSARELSYWLGEKLVAVGIADETPRAISAVYCYHDPLYSKLSLGTYNVLSAIEYARRAGLAHVYLGYRVEGCASLQYKERFRPQERLQGPVRAGETPQWRREDA